MPDAQHSSTWAGLSGRLWVALGWLAILFPATSQWRFVTRELRRAAPDSRSRKGAQINLRFPTDHPLVIGTYSLG